MGWGHRGARAGLAALALAAGCRGDDRPPDTPTTTLAEGRVGERPWRLDGRRADGQLCTALVLEGIPDPIAPRCGLRRTALRHLEPAVVEVEGRLLVFSALPERARRVRADLVDGSLRVTPAQAAPGFPGRYFVLELDPDERPFAVRVFGDGGRAIVT